MCVSVPRGDGRGANRVDELNGMRFGVNEAAIADSRNDPATRRSVYLDKPGDISPMLKLARDHTAEVELRIPGVVSPYTGRILDVTARHFLLEDVRPRDGLRQMRPGVQFSFSARVDDLYLYCDDCKIIEVGSERGLPYFRVCLPTRLLRQRRRRHTRINLPPRVSPNAGTIRMERERKRTQALEGHLIDVSVGGCRAAFKGAVLPMLEVGERLQQCSVAVSGTLNLSTTGVIRHSSWDAESCTTTCGIEFIEMAIPDRRRLEQYVSQLAGKVSAIRGSGV